MPDGTLVGDTLAAQTEQGDKNTLKILKTVGASQEKVVQQTIFGVKEQDIRVGYAANNKSGEISQPHVAWPSLKVLAFLEQ